MDNIKISELNELETRHKEDLLAIVDTNNNETKKIKVETLAPENFELYAIADKQPTIPVGESYYNTTSNKIFTNVGGVYVDKGEPKKGILYIIFSDKATFAYNGTTLVSVGGGSGETDAPIGTITSFAGTTPPSDYLLCDGTAVSRTTYSDLFAIIGTTYGAGDGSTTFNLPNLKGRVPVGYDSNDTDFNAIGKTGGEKTHTLTIDEMPSHNHQQTLGGEITTTDQVAGAGVIGKENQSLTANTGGGQPHNNLQPYIVYNFIIKAKNTTPTMASIVNVKNNSTTDGYSCKYINDLTTYPSTSAGEIVIGQTSDGKPVYRKTIYITQQNQAHGISNLFAVISINAILNNFDYGWVNVSYDVTIQASNIWLRDRALNNVSNGILLTIEYYKSN